MFSSEIPKVTNKCHALGVVTLMKDQSATSLNLHVLETLGVIRQLLILLQNQMGVVRIKASLKDRHIFANEYLARRKPIFLKEGSFADHPVT